MAHIEQKKFMEVLQKRFADNFWLASQIVEVGSRNINGTVREFFSDQATYLGIDIGPGKDVDLVVPGELLELPDGWADIAISTECFEHAETWPQIFENMIRLTRDQGLVILTFAGFGRPAHGTLDSESNSSPFTTYYYKNLVPEDIYKLIQIGQYFSAHAFEVNAESHDTYFWGVRNSAAFKPNLSSWEILEERLARAQGQLSQSAAKISTLSHDLEQRLRQLEEVSPTVEEQRQRIEHLNQAVADRDDQIAGWRQAVLDRESQINHLNQAVAERDHQIAGWHQAVLDRESQINHLNHLLNEQEQRISHLQQSIAEQEAQIAELQPVVKQREEQIAELYPVVKEREEQIAQLYPVVKDREAQIENLRQQLSDREAQITALSDRVEQSEALVLAITKSISWRMMTPLRKLKAKLAQVTSAPPAPVLEPAAQADPLAEWVELLTHSGLFDGHWYLEQHPDIAAAGVDPVRHYLEAGASEGRDPNPLFDSDWYLTCYPDVLAAGVNPLVHYLVTGSKEGRQPHLWFDTAWYLAHYRDVARAGLNPLRHYLMAGLAEGRDPHPLFDTSWYLDHYADIAESGLHPLLHYLTIGAEEGRQTNNFEARPDLIQVSTEIEAGVRFCDRFRISLDDQPQPESNTPQAPLIDQAIADLSDRIPTLTLDNDNPEVSIIIPVYGQLGITLNCLDSLASHRSQSRVEIIVLDDASPTDSQTEQLAAIPWIRYIRQPHNLGFTKNCNYGGAIAKGQVLVFLNSDTRVVANWLDELVLTFKVFPKAGLVGSKLLNGDGSLQEAGGVYWKDGRAWNYGRGDDPYLPQYCYARRVDYCSGAAIAIPVTIWQAVGGFDESYAPAYCEDADLAFRLRESGYDTLYQPLAQVIHYEGKTHGRDVTQGIKAYQVENSKKLFNRWQKQLETHQEPGCNVDQAKDPMAKRRVLVMELLTPTPNQDAGSILVFNIMMLLRDMGFQVTFMPVENFLYVSPHTQTLQRAGIEILHAPYCTLVERHLQSAGERYDLIFMFRWLVVEPNIELVRKYSPNAKVIFYAHDLHYLRISREAELLGDVEKMELAQAMKVRELAAIQSVDASIVVSTAELNLLQQELNAEIARTVYVWPLILEIQGTKISYGERRDIAFIGGYRHAPNIDAVKYFAKDVMPCLRLRLPGVRFFVVGSNPPDEFQALTSDDIVVTGFVEDLNTLLDTIRVAVAPLRFGAGIKGKIGTTLAAGLPTVATTLAAEGMSLTDGENILVADGAEGLADAIARLYDDESLWQQLSQGGLEFASQAWGGEAAWRNLNAILQTLGLDCQRGTAPLTLYGSYRQPPVYPLDNGDQRRWKDLQPVATVTTRRSFEQAQAELSQAPSEDIRASLVSTVEAETFTVEGFCVPCNQTVLFKVDMTCGGQQQGQQWLPNWRERLECPICHMSNRQRLVASLVKQKLAALAEPGATVYFMEQVTPIFQWAVKTFPTHHVVGSEYLGYEYAGGSVTEGIRHEDVMALSFEADSLDLIVSNDVFEHVPDPKAAFQECFRVLKPGGTILATIPFHDNRDTSVTRAELVNGELRHSLPPAYHGNPISAEGSLVFTDFGWDMLDDMRAAGFSTINVEIYASRAFGHMGNGQLVFSLVK